MKHGIIGLLALFLVAAMAGCEARTEGGRVSLVSLVSEPGRFVGKEVTVVGYHSSELEPPVLYVTSEHARLRDWPSGVSLYETVDGTRFSALSRCQNQYVMVVGRFTQLPIEQLGISEIVRVVAMGDGREDSQICFNSESAENQRDE